MSKIRLAWHIGSMKWHQGFTSGEELSQRISGLKQGFAASSHAGVVTYYPPHRISKITSRNVK